MQINYKQNSIDFNLDEYKHQNLYIIGCGKVKLYDKPVFKVNNPVGLPSYQLLYIAEGKGYFNFKNAQNDTTSVNPGNMVIFNPDEFRKCECYAKDNPEIYWIDFAGTEVEELFRKYDIQKESNVYFIGSSLEYIRVFKRIIMELQMKKNCYEELVEMLFKHFLIVSYRIRLNIEKKNNSSYLHTIDQAAQFFNDNYNNNNSINVYAKENGISTGWFIKKFKEYIGLTPDQYIIDIRIRNAKKLLEENFYAIKEIAYFVGYDNPLYFSRLFKKHTGYTPKEYRNNCQKKGI